MKTKAEKIFDFFEDRLPAYYNTDVIRPSQVQMAMDIAAFLNTELKRIMLIEAPVGTGKSLGALIPAMIESEKGKNCRVVYATATINLQGQLMNNEVPLLKKLSLVKQPILAKGKTHYYCHREFNLKKEQFSPKERELFLNFFQNAETGQRNELEERFNCDISETTWAKVALKNSKKACEQCHYSLICPTNIHRQNFMSVANDLIITNHDQLIRSALNQMSEPKQPAIIPTDPGIIIIDEAHHFLENFLNQKEDSFTISDLRSLKRDISKRYRTKYENLINAIEKILNKQAESDEVSLQGRYPITDRILYLLKEVNTIVNESLIQLSTRDLYRISSRSHDDNSELENLSYLLTNIQQNNFVKWVNYEEKKFSLISETFPTDFRKFLELLSRKNKIIVMSGTLTSNGDFDSVINQWRLRKSEVITKKLDTPFDYHNQAIVYIPEDIKDPRSEEYLESCIKEIRSLISLTGGRSLILTTSKDHMISLYESMSPFLQEKNINLFVQEQSGVEKLTEQFKNDETSVLIGSGSFFSGFSVPGKSLVSVILTKLPFPVPDDPFLKLIGQGYEDEFFKLVSFPYMINKLNQAAGRLIRDITDFGVFTILDPRIFTQGYGLKIQEELKKQGYTITRSFEEVKNFMEKKFKFGAEAHYQAYKRDSIVVSETLWETPATKREAKVKIKTRKAKNIITKEQKEFGKEICKRENVNYPRWVKTPDELYQFLIDIYYYDWRDTSISIIENGFPFSDDEEKERLLKIKGTKRKTFMPKCIEFGCNGECREQMKDKIRVELVERYGADDVKFYTSPCKTFCRVLVEPLEILEHHFKPTK